MKVLIADVSGANDNRVLRDYYRDNQGVPERVLIAADKAFEIAQAYRVRVLGETVVIGRDGRIRWQGVWGGDKDMLFPAIEGAAAS